MNKIAILAFSAALLAAGARAEADEDVPQSYDLWFDPLLRPHPKNRTTDVYLDGDTLTIHVDARRLFPEATQSGDLGFAPASAPPDVQGFYVVGSGAGAATPFSIQPGMCTALEKAQADLDRKQKALDGLPADADDTKKKAAKDAVDAADAVVKAAMSVPPATPAYRCSEAPDWNVAPNLQGYICGGDKTLGDLVQASPSWSLVQKLGGNLICANSYTLTPGSAVAAVTAKVTNGSNAPQDVSFSNDKGVYSASIPIKANTRLIVISAKYKDDTVKINPLEIKASARDTHSPVRVQAEVLSTNRLRVISFAVAVSPVAREYFTKGVSGCFFGCFATAVALMRVSGDDHSVVQFGLGVGLGLARGFQLNAGMMFGAPDVNSAWRAERNWFAGVAIDPVILADVVSQGGLSKK